MVAFRRCCLKSEPWTALEDLTMTGGADTKAGGLDTGAVLEA